MAVSWLINGGDPYHLLNGMILQVGDPFVCPIGKGLITPTFLFDSKDGIGTRNMLF